MAADRLKEINDGLRETGEVAAGPWLPLESNPDVFTSFGRRIGLQAPWSFVDVLSLDTELVNCRAPHT